MTREDGLGDDRPNAYLEGDRIIVRASAIGDPRLCPKLGGLAGMTPASPPPWLQKAFDEGNKWEGPVLSRLTHDMDWPMAGLTQTEYDWDLPFGVTVRMHPDEVLYTAQDIIGRMVEGQHVVEVKALSEKNFTAVKRGSTADLPYHYDWQLACLMYGLGQDAGEKFLPGVWVAINKKDPDGDLHIEWVDEPPVSKVEIIKRAKAIRDAYEEGLEPGHVECGGDWCPYEYLHPDTSVMANRRTTDLTPHGRLSDEEQIRLALLCAEYEEHKQAEAFWKKQKDEVRTQIEGLVGIDKTSAAKVFEAAGWEVGYEKTTRSITEVVGVEDTTKWRLKWTGEGEPPKRDPFAGLEALEEGDPTSG